MNQEDIAVAVAYIKKRTSFIPQKGIILGTGLGALVDEVKVECVFDYHEIPNFAVSTVESHQGKLILGTLNEVPVIIMQGRFHFYEGYAMKQVVFPIYVMKQLGIQELLISNISGSLNPEIKAGDLVFINDHINLHAENPLRGKNNEALGPRFPDMFEPYTKSIIQKAEEIAIEHQIKFHHGVYVGLQGPNLETPAEYRYLRIIGGDCVGMSTIPEVIAANHLGLPVFAVAVITDEAFPAVPHRITLPEIIGIAKNTEPKMATILRGLI